MALAVSPFCDTVVNVERSQIWNEPSSGRACSCLTRLRSSGGLPRIAALNRVKFADPAQRFGVDLVPACDEQIMEFAARVNRIWSFKYGSHAFHLQVQEEPLHHRIVATISLAVHAETHMMMPEQGQAFIARILAAPVR